MILGTRMQLGLATFEPFEPLLGPGVCGKLQCLLPRRAIPTFHREAPESGAGCCEEHSHCLFGSLCLPRASACCSPTRGRDRRGPWAPCHRCRRTSRLGLLSSPCPSREVLGCPALVVSQQGSPMERGPSKFSTVWLLGFRWPLTGLLKRACMCRHMHVWTFLQTDTPWWFSSKESTCNAQSCRRFRFNPWVGKLPWRWKLQPTPVFLPGEFHGQRSLAGYSP